jgi:hypothetical protein
MHDSIYVTLAQSVYRESYRGYELVNGEVQEYRIIDVPSSSTCDKMMEKQVTEDICFVPSWKTNASSTALAIDSEGYVYVGTGTRVNMFTAGSDFIRGIGQYFNGVGAI